MIDIFFGRFVGQVLVILYDFISDYVVSELQCWSGEFFINEMINILVGIFNLNGCMDGIDEDLLVWFCFFEVWFKQLEIIVIGFQEIVEFNLQQIMNSDLMRK